MQNDLFHPAAMNGRLIGSTLCRDTHEVFRDRHKARAYLEAVRWPDGRICPHCRSRSRTSPLRGGSTREGVYKCYDCSRPFTVTVGTALEGTKIPLDKWLLAFGMFSARSGRVSVRELTRTLAISYPAARWMHRTISASFAECPEALSPPPVD